LINHRGNVYHSKEAKVSLKEGYHSTNQWIEYLCSCNLISEQTGAPVRGDDNGRSRKYYVKTELGQKVHEVLKSHEHLGSLLDDLSRMKRRRS